eukprot:3941971-Rhodomonas_salina.3
MLPVTESEALHVARHPGSIIHSVSTAYRIVHVRSEIARCSTRGTSTRRAGSTIRSVSTGHCIPRA